MHTNSEETNPKPQLSNTTLNSLKLFSPKSLQTRVRVYLQFHQLYTLTEMQIISNSFDEERYYG